MKIISLFDGISGGKLAAERAGLEVDEYVSYEINPIAISISKHNYPDIIQKGNVITANFTLYKGFDLLLAGFPCQDLSISNIKRKGLTGERSGLFSETLRALKETEAKYFLIENNYKMPEKDKLIISESLGVNPILIDSSIISAQQRKRLYWTNIPAIKDIPQKEIYIKDIIEPDIILPDYYDRVKFSDEKNLTSLSDKPMRIGTIDNGGQGYRVYSSYGKSITITANSGGLGSKTGLYLINNKVRKLSPLEAERCQTLPDGYTAVSGLSDNQRLECIGNGWTIDVISYLLSGLAGESK